MDRHLPQVLQWCARLGGPLVDPEDAAQDVFIVVLTRIGQLRDPELFRPWLFGVVRRVLAKHRRRVWLKRWVGDVPEGALHPGRSPDDMAASIEEGRQVHEALDALRGAHLGEHGGEGRGRRGRTWRRPGASPWTRSRS